MNERIEELAEQCRTITDYGMGKYEQFDDQKFAELIIGECVKIVTDNHERLLTNPEHPGELLEKYFGVE